MLFSLGGHFEISIIKMCEFCWTVGLFKLFLRYRTNLRVIFGKFAHMHGLVSTQNHYWQIWLLSKKNRNFRGFLLFLNIIFRLRITLFSISNYLFFIKQRISNVWEDLTIMCKVYFLIAWNWFRLFMNVGKIKYET